MNQTLPPVFPPQLEPMAEEIRTYFRELPRLLDEGGRGKYAVIRGNEFHGVWSSFHDAIQHGHALFADGKFLAQPIDDRLQAAFGPLFEEPSQQEAEVA